MADFAAPSPMSVPINSVRRAAAPWVVLIKPTLLVVMVVIAYRVSLVTLLEAMRLDTPLAHLALVPLIAVGLAVAARSRDAGPDIHDRQLDWIVGLPLCVGALLVNVILPVRLSTRFWEYRVDLLTLPFFVAGSVALIFGCRTLWKHRAAIVFLMLAWPYPYVRLIDRYLGDFTDVTISAVRVALEHAPVATAVAGSNSRFVVMHDGLPVEMSIASACSGANGLVGFLLVAGAFSLVTNGSRTRKIAWLLTGAALVWLLNLARIMIIFWSAQRWGEGVAIDGFHPYTGLVVFNLGVLVMVLVMRLFGLSLRTSTRSTRRSAAADPDVTAVMAADPLAIPPPPATRHQPRFVAGLFVAATAVTLAAFNADLRSYDHIANSFGAPRLSSFATSLDTPPGWSLNASGAPYDWSKRFFGGGSVWQRYTYSWLLDQDVEFQANVPITVDVIETSDRAALSAYGVEQCYTFHGYTVEGRQTIDLGSGLFGGMLTWTSSKTSLTWTTLYWQWPIKTPSGTRYERVTMVMNDQPTNEFRSPSVTTEGIRQLQLDINDVLRGVGSDEDRARLVETRQFMIGFARQLVDMRAAA